MKKLMLLGGSSYCLPVIETAHRLGIYVITCDYLPDNTAHRYSDEYANISIVEKEAVLTAAAEMKIDGILSFACDPGVTTAAYVAEKLNLPSPGPYESVCILQNKVRFRKFLRENGFNAPKALGLTSLKEAAAKAKDFTFPVIVKPADSAGSKGVSRVENADGLENAARLALSYSQSHEYIIEEFIEKEGNSSDCDALSLDGRLSFIAFNSQLFDEESENPYVPAAYSWPSTFSEGTKAELSSEINRLFSLLHMDSSVWNIETRVGTDGKAYIMECSPRGGGNRLCECLHHIYGADLIDAAVRLAAGLPLKPLSVSKPDGYWAEAMLHSTKEGIFSALSVSEDVKPYLFEEDLWIKKGSRISGFSGANAAVGSVLMHFPDEEKLQSVMDNLSRHIRVTVDE